MQGDPAALSPDHCSCSRPVLRSVVHLSVRPCCSKVCLHGTSCSRHMCNYCAFLTFWSPSSSDYDVRLMLLHQTRRPRGSVGIAALLCRWQTAGGGSIPRWSASKTQDRRPAERQRARTKKEICCSIKRVAVTLLMRRSSWDEWIDHGCNLLLFSVTTLCT